ncbi:MAG: tetraacyldisaccharide 4'-kinase [Candidatus Marinimicrobia bacterium]|nr:tetraacyldisaccharide 4'-kinase [Candidatus Neomarinimicrobiota bacterium]MCF7902528.1 tetraacyldisaccharide 4'-kinase [Candidatus Neomarinimicrobiota bacterium]
MTDTRINRPNLSHLSKWLSPWLLPLRIPLAAVYRVVTALRNWLYNWRILPIKRVPAVVVSVGNLSVGGSGKTLLVEALAGKLKGEGLRVGIVSRGYQRTSRGIQVVSNGENTLLNPAEAGDEPYLLALNLPGVPVMVGADKWAVSAAMCNHFGVQVILLDDGFQHRRLHRDLDLVILNRLPEKLGHSLPWGILRESPRGLQRADMIFYAKLPADVVSQASEMDILLFSSSRELKGANQSELDLAKLPGKIGAFCGLGQPGHFFKTLRSEGISPTVELTFPDHCSYNASDRKHIARAGMDVWITTQKDFVKLPPDFVARQKIYYLPVLVALHPEKWAEILTQVRAATVTLN